MRTEELCQDALENGEGVALIPDNKMAQMEPMSVSIAFPSSKRRSRTTREILSRQRVLVLLRILPLATMATFALYLTYTEMSSPDSLTHAFRSDSAYFLDTVAGTQAAGQPKRTGKSSGRASAFENSLAGPGSMTPPKQPGGGGGSDTHQPGTSSSSAKPRSRCQSWDPGFATRFEATCGPWIQRIHDWRAQLSASEQAAPIQYACEHEEFCHGVGDRLSGIYSVFEAALRHKRPVRVLWQGLTEVFEPTCLMPETWVPQPQDTYDASCRWPAMDLPDLLQENCNPVYHICDNPTKGVKILNFIRGCPTEDTCQPQREQLHSVKKGEIANKSQLGGGKSSGGVQVTDGPAVALTGGTAAHIFGCAMRAMFQVTQGFRNTPVQWIHNQKKSLMTIKQVERLLSGYFTISMHFRLGDGTFRHINQNVSQRWPSFKRMFECAKSVERYVADKGINKGLPIKWIFASDSVTMRKRAVQEFGDKVMMVGERPQHLSLTKRPNVLSAMAEWYLLSLGNRLVLNRLEPMTKEPFSGRLSGFPKTLWAFQLKHLYYDAKTCRLRSLQLDGSWKPENQVCQNLSHDLLGWKLPQSHRDYGDWDRLRHGDLHSKRMAAWYSDDTLFGPPA